MTRPRVAASTSSAHAASSASSSLESRSPISRVWSTSDLEKRLATLPDNSIVYYLIVYEDGAGEVFSPLKYLDRIVAVANAPTYSWSESTMDHGIVGGELLDQAATMKEVAGLSLRVLRGEPAASIAPISSPALRVRQVDWRQIRRWGISPAHISSDTVVRFREPTIWDRYGRLCRRRARHPGGADGA